MRSSSSSHRRAHLLHYCAVVLIFIFAPSRSSSSFCHRIHHRLRAVALIIVFVLSRLSSLLRRCAHLIIALSSAQASLRRQALKLHCNVKRSSFIATSSAQASLRCQALKLHCALERSRSFNAPSSVQASLRRHALKLHHAVVCSTFKPSCNQLLHSQLHLFIAPLCAHLSFN